MPDVAPIARPLRVVWAAVCVGAALAVGGMGWLAVRVERPALAEHAEGAFYAAALLSVAATAGAFALAHRMERRLAEAAGPAEAEARVRSYGVAALAAAEVPALAGAVAAVLTGDLLSLAFAVPFFAFAALLWPSDARVAGWLAAHERGP